MTWILQTYGREEQLLHAQSDEGSHASNIHRGVFLQDHVYIVIASGYSDIALKPTQIHCKISKINFCDTCTEENDSCNFLSNFLEVEMT